jgi:hypothetical protein
MADKRTTPDAPPGAQHDASRGPRRKKRAAPTIDLTATESPPPSDPPSAPAPEPSPAPAQEPPSALVGEVPTETAGPRRGERIGVALLGGAAGAALVTLALVVLWLSGMVPARYAASNDTSAQVAALAAQVRDLKNRPATAPDTTSIDTLTQRVSKIETATKSVGIALTTLNRRNDDVAATASQARERADAAANAVAQLSASVQDVARSNAVGILPAEVDALQKRIAALEQSAKDARAEIAKVSAADIVARLALSAAGLRDAALSGTPFTAELAQAKSLGADDKALAPLVPFAAAGVPTVQALAHELRTLLPAMLKISGAQAPQGGFLERLQANAGKLVRIRPLDAPPGDDASAVLARIEIDAAKADITGALADLGKLAEATRAPARTWIATAKARQAALAAAQQLAANTARALGPKVGAP